MRRSRQAVASLEGRPAWRCHQCDGFVIVEWMVDLPRWLREASCLQCGDRWWLPVFARGAPTRWQARLDLMAWERQGWPRWAAERLAWYWRVVGQVQPMGAPRTGASAS